MHKKKVIIIGISAILALVAWRALSLGLADAYARKDPERALFWRDDHPEALFRMAERHATGRRWPEAKAYAERCLRANPLDGRALRVLAQSAEANGQPTEALDMYRKAAVLAPRDIPSHVWLLAHALAGREAQPAVAHLDALLRLRPASIEALQRQANALAVNPASQRYMVIALAGHPPWRGRFLQGLASSEFRSRDISPLFLQLSRRSGLDPNEFQPWLQRLRSEKRYGQAYVTWANLIPANQRKYLGNVFDGGFELPPDEHVGDFAWNSRDVTGAMVLWTGTRGTVGENSYSVQFEGRRTPFADLSQLLVLPPGEWLLSWRAKVNRLDNPRGLIWRISCENDGKLLADSEPMMGRHDWRPMELRIEVPATCTGQRLTLMIPARIPSETLINGTLWLDEVRIGPVSELP